MKKYFLLYLFFSPTLLALDIAEPQSTCTKCSTELLAKTNLAEIPLVKLLRMKNDLYATKGYRFQKQELQAYYEQQHWYKPAKDNSSVTLTAIEQQNVDLLQKQILILEKTHTEIIAQLEHLTQLAQDKVLLEKTMKMTIDKEHWPIFQKLLNTIDNEALKQSGFYSVNIDNGLSWQGYQAYIHHNQLVLSFNESGDFDDEWAIYWVFELEHQSLKYIRTDIAG